MTIQEAHNVIKNTDPDDPVMTAVATVLEEACNDENIHAIAPSLMEYDRAYNCGRAASLFDMKGIFSMIKTE